MNGRPAQPDGSPPRAWGQRSAFRRLARARRFTPTRVGTTLSSALSHIYLPVHPHARGDNYPSPRRLSVWRGSPPRAWGQRPPHPREACSSRFTPTRVGTTSPRGGHGEARSVHPHARGDNTASDFARPLVAGSPPRAGGQLKPDYTISVYARFTPTRVGTTLPAA